MLLLVGSAGAQSPARRPAATPTGNWQVTTSRSEMTDQLSVTLTLEALNEVPGPIFEMRPLLAVRCREGELDVLITTGAVLDANTSDITHVRIRWGTDPPEEDRWFRSTDYTAAFAPDPKAFLAILRNFPDLRFEFRPFDAAPRVASFNARGLDRHMAKVEAACPSLKDSTTAKPSPPDKADVGIIPSDTQVFMESAVEERPEVLSGPSLMYPDLLRQAGIQGRVIVQAIIDTTGRAEPQTVKIIQSPNPGFDQSAKNYVLRALLRPARVRGRPVRVLLNMPIDFKINR